MKVLIMGCGRVGAHLATLLEADGHEVTILDVDPSGFLKLPHTFRGNALLGDGTDEDSLRRAGIQEMDAFVAVTEADNANIMAAQIAKSVFNVPKVVCRVYDPAREEIYRELGLDTVCPTALIAQSLRKRLS
ncbi:MAG: TrkA family potassium uptake protein [Dehalococcoidia bacterium]|nr:TrkA family potassium uptake protein [Dehalococcoidia bacterium]